MARQCGTAGYQRRSLLFKYSPGQQSWSASYTKAARKTST